jgi:hypothetical protein
LLVTRCVSEVAGWPVSPGLAVGEVLDPMGTVMP